MANEKIFDNEILSDEELDNVAGGSWTESVGDYAEAFNRKLSGFNKFDPYSNEGAEYLMKNWTDGDNVLGKLKAMFASYGIDMEYNEKFGVDNIYTYKGNRITSDQAWNIIDGK